MTSEEILFKLGETGSEKFCLKLIIDELKKHIEKEKHIKILTKIRAYRRGYTIEYSEDYWDVIIECLYRKDVIKLTNNNHYNLDSMDFDIGIRLLIAIEQGKFL